MVAAGSHALPLAGTLLCRSSDHKTFALKQCSPDSGTSLKTPETIVNVDLGFTNRSVLGKVT